MGIHTDHYIVDINIASANSFNHEINQTLEICWAGIKALGGTVVSKLPVTRNAKAGRFQRIDELLLEKSLGQVQYAKYLSTSYLIQ